MDSMEKCERGCSMNYLMEEWKLLYRRLSRIYAIYLLLLILLLLLPKAVKSLGDIIPVLVFTLISAFFVIGTIVLLAYPSYNLVVMIKEKNQKLSKVKVDSYYQTIICKIIINIMVFASGMILGELAESSMRKFSALGISYYEFNLSNPFAQAIMAYGIFFPVLIAFVYLLVSKRCEYNRGLLTFLIVSLIYNSVNGVKFNSILLYLGEILFGIFMVWMMKRIYYRE